jgi:raffinose/stachyose/melibiose transport system permease protein
LNSVETTGLAVLLICSTSSLAAYALARRITRGWRWISAWTESDDEAAGK